METILAFEALCEGIHQSPMESFYKESVMWRFYGVFVICPNKLLNKLAGDLKWNDTTYLNPYRWTMECLLLVLWGILVLL